MGRIILDEVDSTNREAARRAPRMNGSAWILARRQTAGHGRRGRPWSDPPGNFAASLVLLPGGPPARMALYSFVAALALHDAFVAVTGRTDPFALKWPNDVLASGGKVAGILLESLSGPAPALVIGIGVNLVSVPDTVGDGGLAPVSLVGTTGADVAPEELLDHLAPAFARWHGTMSTEGFAPVRDAWLARAARLGQSVTARTVKQTVQGTFETVDANGALVIATAQGRQVIPAAEVFF